MVSKKQLKEQLKKMGILPTDTVLIHTALKAVGEVEDGADGFIDAFCEYLSDGLFVVPTHTWDNVNADHPYYDVCSTVPCIGTVPKIAAFRKDGVRSLHATHSVWAHGKDAEDYVRGEENASSPGPRGFCWDKLADRHAKILLIGVLNNRNTFIHSVDEYVGLPDRISEQPYEVTIVDYEGKEIKRPMHGHRCSKTNDVSQFYVNFEKPMVEMGVQTFGELGNATVRIVDAYGCRELVSRIYRRAETDIFTEFRELPEALYK